MSDLSSHSCAGVSLQPSLKARKCVIEPIEHKDGSTELCPTENTVPELGVAGVLTSCLRSLKGVLKCHQQYTPKRSNHQNSSQRTLTRTCADAWNDAGHKDLAPPLNLLQSAADRPMGNPQRT